MSRGLSVLYTLEPRFYIPVPNLELVGFVYGYGGFSAKCKSWNGNMYWLSGNCERLYGYLHFSIIIFPTDYALQKYWFVDYC